MPAVQRAVGGLGPGRADHHRGARRRRVGGQRPEGVEHQRPPRRPRDAPGSHRLGRAEAPGHHLLRAADEAARRGGAPAAADELPRLVQRGVPHRRPHPEGLGGGRGEPGLDRGPGHPRPRTALRGARPGPVRRHRRRPGPRRGPSRGGGDRQGLRVVPAARRSRRPRRRPRSGPGVAARPRRSPGARPAAVDAPGERVDRRARQGGPGHRPAAGPGGLDRQARAQPRRAPGGTGPRHDRRRRRDARRDRPAQPARRHPRRDPRLGAGAVDRGWDRRDPAEHPRRAVPRPPARAGSGQGRCRIARRATADAAVRPTRWARGWSPGTAGRNRSEARRAGRPAPVVVRRAAGARRGGAGRCRRGRSCSATTPSRPTTTRPRRTRHRRGAAGRSRSRSTSTRRGGRATTRSSSRSTSTARSASHAFFVVRPAAGRPHRSCALGDQHLARLQRLRRPNLYTGGTHVSLQRPMARRATCTSRRARPAGHRHRAARPADGRPRRLPPAQPPLAAAAGSAGWPDWELPFVRVGRARGLRHRRRHQRRPRGPPRRAARRRRCAAPVGRPRRVLVRADARHGRGLHRRAAATSPSSRATPRSGRCASRTTPEGPAATMVGYKGLFKQDPCSAPTACGELTTHLVRPPDRRPAREPHDRRAASPAAATTASASGDRRRRRLHGPPARPLALRGHRPRLRRRARRRAATVVGYECDGCDFTYRDGLPVPDRRATARRPTSRSSAPRPPRTSPARRRARPPKPGRAVRDRVHRLAAVRRRASPRTIERIRHGHAVLGTYTSAAGGTVVTSRSAPTGPTAWPAATRRSSRSRRNVLARSACSTGDAWPASPTSPRSASLEGATLG